MPGVVSGGGATVVVVVLAGGGGGTNRVVDVEVALVVTVVVVEGVVVVSQWYFVLGVPPGLQIVGWSAVAAEHPTATITPRPRPTTRWIVPMAEDPSWTKSHVEAPVSGSSIRAAAAKSALNEDSIRVQSGNCATM